ncbi:MAG: sensor domain-containing diguanylate cyclase, partial [Actinomycetota bacterium]|nr:sensor domain-containing diguanylate cyclase [Actinomycetota bacterium]
QEGIVNQARLLKLLQVVAAAANDAERIEDALQVAVDEVCRTIRWPIGHVYLPVKGLSGKWGPTGIWHVDDPERFETFRRATEITRLDVPGPSLIGRTVPLGRPLWIVDVSRDPDFVRAKLVKDLPLGAAAVFPVMVGAEAVAALEFFSEEPAEPDESLQEVLANIGTLLGRVVERERARLELAEYAAEMKAIALVDELTGLKNRRGFMMLAEQELKLARRTKRAMSLLFFDLDRMKKINDTLGHDVGDRALRDLARALAATFRESDILARIGGDEFCVLLTTESSDQGAEIAVRRLFDAIERHRRTEPRPYELSVSVGRARYDPDNPCSMHELIKQADRRMYERKARKRTVRSG